MAFDRGLRKSSDASKAGSGLTKSVISGEEGASGAAVTASAPSGQSDAETSSNDGRHGGGETDSSVHCDLETEYSVSSPLTRHDDAADATHGTVNDSSFDVEASERKESSEKAAERSESKEERKDELDFKSDDSSSVRGGSSTLSNVFQMPTLPDIRERTVETDDPSRSPASSVRMLGEDLSTRRSDEESSRVAAVATGVSRSDSSSGSPIDRKSDTMAGPRESSTSGLTVEDESISCLRGRKKTPQLRGSRLWSIELGAQRSVCISDEISMTDGSRVLLDAQTVFKTESRYLLVDAVRNQKEWLSIDTNLNLDDILRVNGLRTEDSRSSRLPSSVMPAAVPLRSSPVMQRRIETSPATRDDGSLLRRSQRCLSDSAASSELRRSRSTSGRITQADSISADTTTAAAPTPSAGASSSAGSSGSGSGSHLSSCALLGELVVASSDTGSANTSSSLAMKKSSHPSEGKSLKSWSSKQESLERVSSKKGRHFSGVGSTAGVSGESSGRQSSSHAGSSQSSSSSSRSGRHHSHHSSHNSCTLGHRFRSFRRTGSSSGSTTAGSGGSGWHDSMTTAVPPLLLTMHPPGNVTTLGKPHLKKFRDAIYAGNLERVMSCVEVCVSQGVPMIYFGLALMRYSHRLISPLGLACRRGHIHIVRYLLEVCICGYLDRHREWPLMLGRRDPRSSKNYDSSLGTSTSNGANQKTVEETVKKRGKKSGDHSSTDPHPSSSSSAAAAGSAAVPSAPVSGSAAASSPTVPKKKGPSDGSSDASEKVPFSSKRYKLSAGLTDRMPDVKHPTAGSTRKDQSDSSLNEFVICNYWQLSMSDISGILKSRNLEFNSVMQSSKSVSTGSSSSHSSSKSSSKRDEPAPFRVRFADLSGSSKSRSPSCPSSAAATASTSPKSPTDKRKSVDGKTAKDDCDGTERKVSNGDESQITPPVGSTTSPTSSCSAMTPLPEVHATEMRWREDEDSTTPDPVAAQPPWYEFLISDPSCSLKSSSSLSETGSLSSSRSGSSSGNDSSKSLGSTVSGSSFSSSTLTAGSESSSGTARITPDPDTQEFWQEFVTAKSKSLKTLTSNIIVDSRFLENFQRCQCPECRRRTSHTDRKTTGIGGSASDVSKKARELEMNRWVIFVNCLFLRQKFDAELTEGANSGLFSTVADDSGGAADSSVFSKSEKRMTNLDKVEFINRLELNARAKKMKDELVEFSDNDDSDDLAVEPPSSSSAKGKSSAMMKGPLKKKSDSSSMMKKLKSSRKASSDRGVPESSSSAASKRNSASKRIRRARKKRMSELFEVAGAATFIVDRRRLPQFVLDYLKSTILNAFDGDRRTPLSHAVEKGHFDMVNWLLDHCTVQGQRRRRLRFGEQHRRSLLLGSEVKEGSSSMTKSKSSPMLSEVTCATISTSQPTMGISKKSSSLSIVAGSTVTSSPTSSCPSPSSESIESVLMSNEHGLLNVEKGGEHHDEFWTPLHYASRYGHAKIVRLLVEKGRANCDGITSKKKSCSLHLACATGNLKAVEVLLSLNCNCNLEDMYFCSPFSLAIHFEEKMVQELLFSTNRIHLSSHDIRRLKKDDHMFRRFYWIKLARMVELNVPLTPAITSSDSSPSSFRDSDSRAKELSDKLPDEITDDDCKNDEYEKKEEEKECEKERLKTAKKTDELLLPKKEVSLEHEPSVDSAIVSVLTKRVVLPVDLWVIICGFMDCYDLLVNVRRVCYGLLVAVHHPALRKLVNFADCLPKAQRRSSLLNMDSSSSVSAAMDARAADEQLTPLDTVEYSPHQKLLTLKRPSKKRPLFRDAVLNGFKPRPFVNGGICDREYHNRPKQKPKPAPSEIFLPFCRECRLQMSLVDLQSQLSAGFSGVPGIDGGSAMLGSGHTDGGYSLGPWSTGSLARPTAGLETSIGGSPHSETSSLIGHPSPGGIPTPAHVGFSGSTGRETLLSPPVSATALDREGSPLRAGQHSDDGFGDASSSLLSRTHMSRMSMMSSTDDLVLPAGSSLARLEANTADDTLTDFRLQSEDNGDGSDSSRPIPVSDPVIPDSIPDWMQLTRTSASATGIGSESPPRSLRLARQSSSSLPFFLPDWVTATSVAAGAAPTAAGSAMLVGPSGSSSLTGDRKEEVVTSLSRENSFSRGGSLTREPTFSAIITGLDSEEDEDEEEEDTVKHTEPEPRTMHSSRLSSAQSWDAFLPGSNSSGGMPLSSLFHEMVAQLPGHPSSSESAAARTVARPLFGDSMGSDSTLSRPTPTALPHLSLGTGAVGGTSDTSVPMTGLSMDGLERLSQEMLSSPFAGLSGSLPLVSLTGLMDAGSHSGGSKMASPLSMSAAQLSSDSSGQGFFFCPRHGAQPGAGIHINSRFFDAVAERESKLTEPVLPELSEDVTEWKIHEDHCAALSFAADFAPVNLRKIRLSGNWILSQPILTAISCLSFIVHLELSHFNAESLIGLDLSCLQRLNKLRMVRQLKIFPFIRKYRHSQSIIDAVALSDFIEALGATALTVGLKWDQSMIPPPPAAAASVPLAPLVPSDLDGDGSGSISGDSATSMDDSVVDSSPSHPFAHFDSMDQLVAVSEVWGLLFSKLPSNIRSLRLHFGETDSSLNHRCVQELVNYENIKCFTLHGDPGLNEETETWARVFNSWPKLRYVVLGHRGASGHLSLPRLILEALPNTLPELALNVSSDSIHDVMWYLNRVVDPHSFLRINLHVTATSTVPGMAPLVAALGLPGLHGHGPLMVPAALHGGASEMHFQTIENGIIDCLCRFPNLETAYLKCGIVTLAQMRKLLGKCSNLSFVGFGIDTEESNQIAIRDLLEEFGFDKTVVKTDLNWLISVKSYDEYLLHPSRCIHPVLEAFDGQ